MRLPFSLPSWRSSPPPSATNKRSSGSAVQLPRLSSQAARADAAIAIGFLREFGAIRVDSVLSLETCARIRAHADGALSTALHDVKTGHVRATAVFAEHLLLGEQAGKRHDVKLSLDDVAVQAATADVLQTLRGIYEGALGLSLEELEAQEASQYATPLLRRGDAVLMDSACFHAGGANTLRPRTLFHLSFARRGFEPRGFDSFAQSLDADDAKAKRRLYDVARLVGVAEAAGRGGTLCP